MIKKIFIFLSLVLLSPSAAQGTELKLTKSMETMGTDDTFNVTLMLNTESEYINAVEASLKYTDNLELQNISDGNSVINLWIAKPKLENRQSQIFLSGLIPGGLKTETGIILNFTFKSLRGGTGQIRVEDAKIFINNPDASETKTKTSNLEFKIQNYQNSVSEGQKLVLDFLPPDDFQLYPSKDKNIFDNAWFISFNAQDKGSGINHYEIRERFLGLWGNWKISESPYLLSDQLLLSIIEVKAVDNVERERVTVFIPTRLYAFYIILVGLILATLLIRVIKHLKFKHKGGI